MPFRKVNRFRSGLELTIPPGDVSSRLEYGDILAPVLLITVDGINFVYDEMIECWSAIPAAY
jgi:hypothetical protein